MDHICPCNELKKNSSNGYYRNVQWYNRPGQFSGTLVYIYNLYPNEIILKCIKYNFRNFRTLLKKLLKAMVFYRYGAA